jgi:hypothetical protein
LKEKQENKSAALFSSVYMQNKKKKAEENE